MKDERITITLTFNTNYKSSELVARYLKSFEGSITKNVIELLHEKAVSWDDENNRMLVPEIKITDPHLLPLKDMLHKEPAEMFFNASEEAQERALKAIQEKKLLYDFNDVNNILERGLIIPDYLIKKIIDNPESIHEYDLRLPKNWRDDYDSRN